MSDFFLGLILGLPVGIAAIGLIALLFAAGFKPVEPPRGTIIEPWRELT